MSIYKKYKNPGSTVAVCLGKVAMVFSVILLLCSTFAQAADRVLLKSLDFTALPNDEVEIRLGFDGVAPQPVGYVIEKPARISLDLPNVKNGLSAKYHSLGVGNARSLTVVDTADRTRMIISLAEMTGYSARVSGNSLVLTVGKNQLQQTPQAAVKVAGVPAQVRKSVEPELSSVDFRRGEHGDGSVQIELSVPGISVDVKQQGTKIVAKFIGARLPERLRRRLDVTDFATPVKTIDTMLEAGNTVMVIQPTGDFEYLAYQADNKFTISVKPVTAEAKKRKDAFAYNGEKLSLNFQDIDVRSVLQLIADFTSMNLVASDTVSGKITLRLQNVPWDQALELILKTKGLEKRTVGNVMLVAPADEIAQRERLELESNQQAETLAPLRTEYIQINYTKVMDVMPILTGDRKMLSARGSAVADPRTNTLVIYDTSKKIEDIRELVTKLDIPVKQVMIEARVVLASNNFAKEIGVKWGSSGISYNDSRTKGKIWGGSHKTAREEWDGMGLNSKGQLAPDTITITNPDDLMVDLGVDKSGASSITLGVINSAGNFLDLELSALESDGHGEIVASPRVLTADKQKARIASGQQIPYQKSTSSGATAIEFINAELSLEVTPNITPDGRVQMDLLVNKDAPNQIPGNSAILIDTNRVATSVLVDDGDTVVLGGIFQNTVSKGVVKTPFLGDIPYIGRLFRKNVERNDKQELLIFVTPRIVSSALAVSN